MQWCSFGRNKKNLFWDRSFSDHIAAKCLHENLKTEFLLQNMMIQSVTLLCSTVLQCCVSKKAIYIWRVNFALSIHSHPAGTIHRVTESTLKINNGNDPFIPVNWFQKVSECVTTRRENTPGGVSALAVDSPPPPQPLFNENQVRSASENHHLLKNQVCWKPWSLMGPNGTQMMSTKISP